MVNGVDADTTITDFPLYMDSLFFPVDKEIFLKCLVAKKTSLEKRAGEKNSFDQVHLRKSHLMIRAIMS